MKTPHFMFDSQNIRLIHREAILGHHVAKKKNRVGNPYDQDGMLNCNDSDQVAMASSKSWILFLSFETK